MKINNITASVASTEKQAFFHSKPSRKQHNTSRGAQGPINATFPPGIELTVNCGKHEWLEERPLIHTAEPVATVALTTLPSASANDRTITSIARRGFVGEQQPGKQASEPVRSYATHAHSGGRFGTRQLCRPTARLEAEDGYTRPSPRIVARAAELEWGPHMMQRCV